MVGAHLCGQPLNGQLVELWQMDEAGFGSFVASIPAPLGIGTLTLADGRSVKGFLREATPRAAPKTSPRSAGWRAWLGRSTGAPRANKE